MAHTLITVPANAGRGETIEIRALIQHPMETGYRRSNDGAMMARDLIRRFTCRFEDADAGGNNEVIFSAVLHAAIAANPYLAFHTIARASGTFILKWEGDNGFEHSERVAFALR